ncbi:hypothetical protein ACFQZU_05610, partial [Streptomonospora algeriensis]
MAPERTFVDLDERAALFRSRLDGKSMLVFLPPRLSPCEGARKVRLETLSVEESLTLLREHLGPARVDGEPETARALVSHCAQLPLALRILAERLNELADVPLATIAAELSAEDERLDGLGGTGDELSDVRAVFSASYGALAEETAGLFRTLGVYPGDDFTPASCGAAAG